MYKKINILSTSCSRLGQKKKANKKKLQLFTPLSLRPPAAPPRLSSPSSSVRKAFEAFPSSGEVFTNPGGAAAVKISIIRCTLKKHKQNDDDKTQ